MGHYKVIADMCQSGRTLVAEILVTIINIALITSRPLRRWKKSAQIMLEKGKGQFVEHLRIIQLCEADLNFMLNIIWGHRLTRHALKNNLLNTSQYAQCSD
jgi:ATP phosphoribosyltransferase